MSSDVAISVRNVSKKFRLFSSPTERLAEALHPFRKQYHHEFWALKNVSFDVHRGEIVGILGRNGSGKSTLLQIICAVMQATEGEVHTNGRISALLELGAGFNPEFTGRENVLLNGAIMGFSRKEMEARMPDIEAFANIGQFFDQPVKTYSSGMFVRVAFAAAINVDPKVLVVDEALSVGDAAFQRKCFERISELKRSGTTILFVSHDEGTIANVCDRAVVMSEGQIAFSGSVRDSISHYHSLLNGRGETRRAAARAASKPVRGAERRDQPAGELEEFLSTAPDTDNCLNRKSYNASETRVGNGKAEIVDYLLVFDGKADPVEIAGRNTLDAYIKVRFHDDIPRPAVGFRIFTGDYVKIFAQNTRTMEYTLAPRKAGDIGIYRFTVDLSLAGGSYFVNMGIDEVTADGPEFSDARRGIAQLSVTPTPWCEGIVDLSKDFEETTLRDT